MRPPSLAPPQAARSAGDRAAALGTYARLRDRLAADLEIAPSASTRQLAELIRAGGAIDQPAPPPGPRDRSADSVLGGRPESSPASEPIPPVHYTHSGEINIAYQVIGHAPVDLVLVPGFVWHLEAVWEHPAAAAFLRSLGAFSRLILFDKRGMGLSDRQTEPPTLEQGVDDLLAVLGAAGSERAVLLGISEGGPMSIQFAALYPERTAGLALYGSYASILKRPGYPTGITAAELERFFANMKRGWGGPVLLRLFGPSATSDESVRRWWARLLRLGTSPGAIEQVFRLYDTLDVRPALASIRVPTLVLNRVGDRVAPAEGARWLADQIHGARYVELPGNDHIPALGDTHSLLAELHAFTTEAVHARAATPFGPQPVASPRRDPRFHTDLAPTSRMAYTSPARLSCDRTGGPTCVPSVPISLRRR